MINIDFTNNELSNVYYGGSERKLGVLIDGQKYMLKFQKKTPFGMRYNHISEYLGSHIYQMLGFECQDTILGTYQEQNVVACRDFVTDECQFVPFNDVGESTLDEDKETFQDTGLTDIHKTFYKVMLTNRCEKILKNSYFKLTGEQR